MKHPLFKAPRFAAIMFGTMLVLTFIMCLTGGAIALMAGYEFAIGFNGVSCAVVPEVASAVVGFIVACHDGGIEL